MSAAELQTFYQGDLAAYNILQFPGLLIQKMDKLSTIFDNHMKWLFPLLKDQVSFNRLLLKKMEERGLSPSSVSMAK